MERAIDADRLLQVLEANFGHTGGADVMRQLIEAQPTLTPPNEPLTLEQLQEIVEPTPIWWDWICGWVLARKGMITTWSGRYHNAEELQGSFYRRPPEGENN